MLDLYRVPVYVLIAAESPMAAADAVGGELHRLAYADGNYVVGYALIPDMGVEYIPTEPIGSDSEGGDTD